jgi:hypothetical protein
MRGRLPSVGTFAGTGAALSVNVGFRPKAILFYNETDAASTNFAIAIDGQADAAGFKGVDSGAGTTDLSNVTVNGITFTSFGFTVGTDAAMNINGKTYRYVAW